MNINSPIEPLLVAPDGKRIGIDPVSGQFVNEIPHASYTGPAVEPQSVLVPDFIPGTYSLSTKGNGVGSYLIEKTVEHSGIVVERQTINGATMVDALHQFNLVIDTVQTSVPPPSDLQATNDESNIHLGWSSVPGAAGYKIYYDCDRPGVPYRGEGAAEGTSPIDLGNRTSFTLTGLKHDTTYYLGVTSYDFSLIQGGISKEVSIFTGTTGNTEDPHRDHTQPRSIELEQNYPNPFNPTTTIRYGLPNRSHVLLTVYSTLGQKVAELVNGDINAGYHEVNFNAGYLASGVYFYRLLAGSFVETRKLILLK